jgi:hypothetical protein
MRYSIIAVTLASLSLVVLSPTARCADKAKLKVLYAGNLESPRGKDFLSFLEKSFAKAGSVQLGKFEEDAAKDYDVVIFDWTSIYPRDKDGKISYDKNGGGFSSPPAPRLSQKFNRASILIGAAGGQISGPLQLKIDWL